MAFCAPLPSALSPPPPHAPPHCILHSIPPQGISDIITVPGLINVDFADVKAIMSNSGTAMLGVGVASGRDRAEQAALAATAAPLIQRSIERATGARARVVATASGKR